MKTEVICPRGHRIPDDAEGVLSFSMLADERLNVSIECYPMFVSFRAVFGVFEEGRRREAFILGKIGVTNFCPMGVFFY